MRQFRWQVKVRSYEVDAWGCLPAAGMLRYMEHSAVMAAADAGYGEEFHERTNSAWVIRRMALVMPAAVRQGHELEIVTWASHFARVRGGREYHVFGPSGEMVARGLAEWVYIDRATLLPQALPPDLAANFDTPGAPLLDYGLPALEGLSARASDGPLFEQTLHRTAEWHECDSMGHVNNTNYAGWLDDATYAAVEALGTSMARQREQGTRLNGLYYKLDYKRAALPGDNLALTTRIYAATPQAYSVTHRIALTSGEDVLTADCVYEWVSNQ